MQFISYGIVHVLNGIDSLCIEEAPTPSSLVWKAQVEVMTAFCVDADHDAVSIARDTCCCILYVNGNQNVRTEHSYVMVKCTLENGKDVRIAYAKLVRHLTESQSLCKSVNASDAVVFSSGLRVALRLKSAELTKMDASAYCKVEPKVDYFVHENQSDTTSTTPLNNAKSCSCEVGVIDSATLELLDFQILNTAARRSLMQVTTQVIVYTTEQLMRKKLIQF